MIRHLYNLRSDHLDKSRTHLTPHKVIKILLTIFPVLYFTSPWLFCNYHPVLNSLTFSLISRPLTHLATIKMFSVSMSSLLFLLFVYCLDFTYEWNHMVFVFLCLTYFTQHNTLSVHPCHCRWQDFILFYGWAIFHCKYVPLLSPFIYWWTLRLLPYLGYCKVYYNEYMDAHVFSN